MIWSKVWSEVLVRVKAAGICSSDIPRVFGEDAHRYPLVPGHEFSGVVVDVSESEFSGLLGKRVGVFPLILCMECESCKKHMYETCGQYSCIGSGRDDT